MTITRRKGVGGPKAYPGGGDLSLAIFFFTLSLKTLDPISNQFGFLGV